jgi:hypothetical protein
MSRSPSEKASRADTAPLAPDLELGISLDHAEGRWTLTFELHGYDPKLAIDHRIFEPVHLAEDPRSFLVKIFGQVEELPNDGGLSPDDILRELEDFGSFLYQKVLPPGLGPQLEEHQGRSLQIHSQEPWIPWECVRLERDEDGRRVPGDFLCEAFDLSRWLGGRPQPLGLSLRRLALVAWEGTDLDLTAEIDFLESLRAPRREVERVPARPDSVRQAFAAGRYDGFHFSGHSEVSGHPDQAELHLEDHTRFTPLNLRGEARNLGRRQPLIFLNACRTGRTGFSLTGLGGWAEHFLAVEAGAFIGTHWAVRNRRAGTFAQAFYQAFLGGAPIARAFREARQAVKSPGDPSWLAYTLYAHPLARAAASRCRPFTSALEQIRPEADDVLTSPEPRGPRDASSPGALLRADYGVVPFHGRDEEIEDLYAWCVEGEPIQIRLYTGPGGMGKTRLALEICAHLRDEGWKAGFLDPRLSRPVEETWPLLLRGGKPVLMVRDYAELRTERLAPLLHKMARHRDLPVRLLLLSRTAGDWWGYLKREGDGVGELIRGRATRHLSLGPLALTLPERRESLETAARAFAAKLDKPVPGRLPKDLEADYFDRVLLLHTTALAAIEGVRLKSEEGEDGILDYILDRERRFWQERLRTRELPPSFFRGLGQVMAIVTLEGGVASEGRALEIFESLTFFGGRPRDLLVEAAYLLHECYPGPAGLWIEPVQPDLLGEHLVMQDAPKTEGVAMDQVFGPRDPE